MRGDVRFGVLGPLEVYVEGVPARLGGPKQRGLLALLLLSANRVVPRDRLIEELLGDHGADASHALRVHVSRLRKALGAAGERVESRAPGYLLAVEPGELDLDAFEQLALEGRRALHGGDAEEAARVFRAAESLWRGRPLSDLEFEPYVRLEVDQIEERRLAVVEERIEAELQLGRHAALASELDSLVLDHPLRERFRAQQMLALYRDGRQADALRAYRRARSHLAEELALEPSPQLRELERAILRQDAELELSRAATAVLEPPPAAPEPIDPLPDERRRRSLLWIAAALVVMGATAAVALAVSGAAKRVRPLSGHGLAAIAPKSGRLDAAVTLPSSPTRLAEGFGSVWVSEIDAGRVVRVDAKSGGVVATIQVGRGPSMLAVGAGDVWVVNTLDGTLSRIDPGSNTVTQVIGIGSDPGDVLVDGGNVWVARHGDGTVVRIDPESGGIRAVLHTGVGPAALAAGGGVLWVADDEAGTVTAVDEESRAVTERIHVGDAPWAIAATPSAVWVLDRLDSTLSRIDPQRGVVDLTRPVPAESTGLAVREGAVWISDSARGRLLRFDPRTGLERHAVAVGQAPADVIAPGRVWVAVAAGGADHRGGTLHAVYTAVTTIDPGGGTSPNLAPLMLLGLLNDGLVTLDHVAGPEGARLVPDLALSVPRPGAHGRRYTFRLRSHIRYSTGAVVTPRDVRRSFERLFELGSSGAQDYTAIAGASACRRPHVRCDLSRGIVVDDRARTVTFRLDRSDPDFLYKLTLPYAFVLPAATPSREARTPLPATGPYMIERYVPGRVVRLVRNPRFREWSAAAQPSGYPDRIVIRLGVAGPQGTKLVTAGRVDFIPSLAAIQGGMRSLLIHHPGLVRSNPGMITAFLFLNVNVPPLDDVRVRRALNYAIDRVAIVAADGGPLAAQPSCQVLPPLMPGYVRYCPYARDLARARRLVRASGTKGMQVTVWDTAEPPIALNEGRITVDALRELGYDAKLRLLPDSTFFSYTGDSRNRAQIVDGGWSADYASANDFLGKLTCDYFVPGNGPATTDAAGLCDPAFDAQVTRAARLQTTNPSAANALWSRLDRQVTDRAVFLPTVTVNETDLVSARVGNYQYNPVWGALIDQFWVR